MKNKTFDIKDASSTQTADILGITRQRVSQLRSAGVLKNNGKRGRYDLAHVIQDYAAYLTDNGGGDAQTQLIIQRTRKLRIANDKAEAGLLSIDDAGRVLTTVFQCFQSLSQDLPKKLAPKLAKAKTSVEVRRTMEKEFSTVREKIGAELKTACGLPLDADMKAIKARLR